MGRLVLVWVTVLASLATSALILAVPLGTESTATLAQVGLPAPQDILAPTALTYRSDILTEQAQATAARAVPDVYDAPDARIARQQVISLRDILDYITLVRADTLAAPVQKYADLTAIRDLGLTNEEAALVLNLDIAAWEKVQAEALSVLEQIMRGQVRADQLTDSRRAVPARISVNLDENEATVTTILMENLIIPNSFYNAEATEAARLAAQEAVLPIYKTVLRGQVVVARGQVVTDEDIEALEALGLLQPQTDWRVPVSASLFATLIGLVAIGYVWRFNRSLVTSYKHIVLLCVLFLVFLLTAKVMVPGRTLLPFFVPAGALAMLVTVLADAHLGMILGICFAAMVGYLGNLRLELMVYMAVGGLAAALTLGRAERVNQFFYAGITVAGANIIALLVFRLNDQLDLLGGLQLLGASLLNGAVSASIALVGMFALGLFDITTSLQLIELSRPDQPLLRDILRHAPGTYQHSLQVSNLAEQAAERIGANALLTRVGALYHDVGKMLHPQFFVENQLDGINIHDSLDPTYSAQIIINHVTDGMELAAKHHLPTALRAFIAEHHGTLKTMYQYQRALKAAGDDPSQIDASQFVYPGPRPQSKETALLMLADGCEARARSERPKAEEDIDRIVKFVLEDRLAKGQLDDTQLTVQDLAVIRESFVNTLKGVFHPRIQYPDEKPPSPPSHPEASSAPPK